VALQYLESWLRGTGAAGIYNLMEDAATAEISRSQVWQWIHHDARLADERKATAELYRKIIPEELEKIKKLVGEEFFKKGKYDVARQLFDKLVTDKNFTEFLTLIAYEHLN